MSDGAPTTGEWRPDWEPELGPDEVRDVATFILKADDSTALATERAALEAGDVPATWKIDPPDEGEVDADGVV